MWLRLLFLIIATTASIAFAKDDDTVTGVVRTKGGTRPAAMSAPLTPSLQCSACEVTVRELAANYAKRSVHNKYFGTDVELAEVTSDACESIPKQRYHLAQERFGAHLKVFAKPNFHYDDQTTEPPQFYHEKDEQRYTNSVNRLQRFCEAFVEKFYESHIRRHVKQRTELGAFQRDMCNGNATKLCALETLKPYRLIEERKRRRWKKLNADVAAKAKLERELNEQISGVVPSAALPASGGEMIDLASTEDL